MSRFPFFFLFPSPLRALVSRFVLYFDLLLYPLPPFSLHFSLVSPYFFPLHFLLQLLLFKFQSILVVSFLFFSFYFHPFHPDHSRARTPFLPFLSLLFPLSSARIPFAQREESLRNLSPRVERLRPKESNKRTPLQLRAMANCERESRPEGISLR